MYSIMHAFLQNNHLQYYMDKSIVLGYLVSSIKHILVPFFIERD